MGLSSTLPWPDVRASFQIGAIGKNQVFPLAISSNSRFLQSPSGTPFLVVGNALWSIESQLTRTQIDTALNSMITQGFNSILFESFEHLFSNQTPPYVNAEGNAPFTSMSGASPPYTVDFSTANTAYWGLVDYILQQCLAKGILCLVTLGYYGFAGTQEGWSAELTADTSAHLQALGVFLATRYSKASYPNVIWVAGGDNTSGAALYTQIMNGMQSVESGQLVSGHSARGNDAFSAFSTVTGFNVNSQYSNNASNVGDAATAYARNIPFFLIEDEYENTASQSNQTQRCQKLQSLLSGGCGFFFGNDPLWSFGNDTFEGLQCSVPTCLSTYLSTTASNQMRNIATLLRSINWQLLTPQTGTSLVTTTLGTGASAICASLTSDTQAALIYTPVGTGFTVNLAAFSKSSLIARWFDLTNGTFSAVSGSPFANTGTHAFTTPGTNAGGDSDWALVFN